MSECYRGQWKAQTAPGVRTRMPYLTSPNPRDAEDTGLEATQWSSDVRLQHPGWTSVTGISGLGLTSIFCFSLETSP